MAKANHVHHISMRKRRHAKKKDDLHPYPHPEKKMRMLDSLVLVVAIAAPVMFIPQIYEIFMSKNASGVNPYSFAASAVLAIPWTIYGVVHREKVIVVSSVLVIIVDIIISAGAMLYG